jgi:hypothetical protein
VKRRWIEDVALLKPM